MSDKILAIDFGRRRVGVAVSDALGLLAHARETLHYTSRRDLYDRLQILAREEGAAQFVIGLPRRMDGSEGDMAELVRAVAHELGERTGLPVKLWDERFTSVQAERLLTERGISFSREKDRVDRLAAVFILQSYLDRAKSRPNDASAAVPPGSSDSEDRLDEHNNT